MLDSSPRDIAVSEGSGRTTFTRRHRLVFAPAGDAHMYYMVDSWAASPSATSTRLVWNESRFVPVPSSASRRGSLTIVAT